MIGRRWSGHEAWRWLRGAIAIAAACAVSWPLVALAAAATPTVAITPDRGSCDTPIVVRGGGFAPGQNIGLTARATGPRGGSHLALGFAAVIVAGDGAFAIAVEPRHALAGCQLAGSRPADGTEYTIYATTNERPGRDTLLATDRFTIDRAAHLPPVYPDANPAPRVALDPERGPCSSRITARGVGFPTGQPLTLYSTQFDGPPDAPTGMSNAYITVARPVAAADGSFAVAFDLPPLAVHGCGKCGIRGCGADPSGEQYRIVAISDTLANGRNVVAGAAFTVNAPALPPHAMPRAGGGGGASGD